jgi:hypothetical protein
LANVNEYLAQVVASAKAQEAAQLTFLDEMRREWERLRGVKIIRYGPVTGTAAGSALTISGDQQGAGQTTPDQGFGWSVIRLIVEGLSTGATPDVVNIVRGRRIEWQLNGNQFGQLFSKGALPLFPGETLGLQSVGTFNATGVITLHGIAWQMPAEELAKLL